METKTKAVEGQFTTELDYMVEGAWAFAVVALLLSAITSIAAFYIFRKEEGAPTIVGWLGVWKVLAEAMRSHFIPCNFIDKYGSGESQSEDPHSKNQSAAKGLPIEAGVPGVAEYKEVVAENRKEKEEVAAVEPEEDGFAPLEGIVVVKKKGKKKKKRLRVHPKNPQYQTLQGILNEDIFGEEEDEPVIVPLENPPTEGTQAEGEEGKEKSTVKSLPSGKKKAKAKPVPNKDAKKEKKEAAKPPKEEKKEEEKAEKKEDEKEKTEEEKKEESKMSEVKKEEEKKEEGKKEGEEGKEEGKEEEAAPAP